MPFLSSQLCRLPCAPCSVQGNAVSRRSSALRAASLLTPSYLKLPALARIGVCLSLPSAPAQTSGTGLGAPVDAGAFWDGEGAERKAHPSPLTGALPSWGACAVSVSLGLLVVHVFMTCKYVVERKQKALN